MAAAIERAGWLSFLLLLGCQAEPSVEASDRSGSTFSGGSDAVASDGAARAASDPAADEAELIRLERDYARALIRKDRDFLMRFYAPDWRGGNWMGFWTKSTMMRSVLGDQYVVKSMTLRNVKVRVIGDVGIVQGLDEEVTSVRGRDTSGTWSFTDIFARRDGRWVAVASHTSEVKPEAR